LLANQGLIARESRGTSVYYRIADDTIDALCDLVCGSLARRFEQRANETHLFSDRSQAA
jgi:DNA-binding transcriptional ArsR family regulator